MEPRTLPSPTPSSDGFQHRRKSPGQPGSLEQTPDRSWQATSGTDVDGPLAARYRGCHEDGNMYPGVPGEAFCSVSLWSPLYNDATNLAQGSHSYNTPNASPPSQPRSAEVVTTRVLRSHTNDSGKPTNGDSYAKKPRGRRTVGKAKASAGAKGLARPLSELAKDYPAIIVADIDAYVHRSTEERIMEVRKSKVPGKVKRPMNAFMLYRKAYHNLARTICTQNNHQVLSQVCGGSWREETDKVNEQFSEWAKIERSNHQTAHPDYKFAPSRLKRTRDDDDEFGPSDGEDRDYEEGLSEYRDRKQQKVDRTRIANTATPLTNLEQGILPTATLFSNSAHFDIRGSRAQPPYRFPDIEWPAQAMHYQTGMEGSHYYQHIGQAHLYQPAFVDSLPAGGGYMQPQLARSMAPLNPGFAPRQPYEPMGPSGLMRGIAVDPSLVAFGSDPNIFYEAAFGRDRGWRTQLEFDRLMMEPSSPTHHAEAMVDPALSYLKGEDGDWQVQEIDEKNL